MNDGCDGGDNVFTCGRDWPVYLAVAYVAADVLMLMGYTVLCYLFLHYLRPRHVTVLRKIFVLLGLVVLLCGITHGVRIVGFLFGYQWYMVVANVLSGLAIVTLLVILVPMLPAIMKFPSASAMSKANSTLREEVSDLLETNAKLASVDNLRAVANITCAIEAIRKLAPAATAK